jgi:hypothetical protein
VFGVLDRFDLAGAADRRAGTSPRDGGRDQHVLFAGRPDRELLGALEHGDADPAGEGGVDLAHVRQHSGSVWSQNATMNPGSGSVIDPAMFAGTGPTPERPE